jgi:uncharacterized protein (TIGR02452 family)
MTMASQKFGDRRGASLASIAEETINALPWIVQNLPDIDAAKCVKYELGSLPPLNPAECPRFTLPCNKDGTIVEGGKVVYGTRVSVVNQDSFDAAIAMSLLTPSSSSSPSSPPPSSSAAASTTGQLEKGKRVAVLNLASDKNPGGGWLHGAAAQEECLFFRSSLSLSLRLEDYPWQSPLFGTYSPDVVIIRAAMADGHALLARQPGELPVMSVISIAGLRSPPLGRDGEGGLVFRDEGDRKITKDKMRLCLRIAGREGHGRLVLGALGCGAFANPPGDVARCWLEVLKEDEFRGGWFDEVRFAVFDSRGEGNFEVFRRTLDEVVCGED